VARIEVIRGGAPGIDMQGKTAVANVITRRGRAAEGQASASVTHLGDGRSGADVDLQGSGAAGPGKWEGSFERGKGFDISTGDGASVTLAANAAPLVQRIDGNADGHIQIGTAAVEQPLAGGKLRLNGRFLIDKYKFEEDLFDPSGQPALSTDQRIRTRDYEAGGRFGRKLADLGDLELVSLFHPKEVVSTAVSGPQVFALDRDSYEAIGRGTLKRPWGAKASTEVGGELARNRLQSRTRFTVDGATVGLPAANVGVEELRGEGFVKAAWRPRPAWTLDGGVRVERSTITASGDVALEKTLTFVKPRLNVSWAADARSQVSLRLEREVGQLDFDAFVASASLNTATGVTAGNPDLAPEQAWTAELVFERRFWARGAAVVTLQALALSDVVDRGPVFTPDGVFDRPTNIGDGRKALAKLDLTVPLDGIGMTGAQLKGMVLKRWSEVRDPTTGETRPISGLQPDQWEAHFSWDLPARRMSWGADAYGGSQQTWWRFNAVDTVKVGKFYMVFVEWRPTPKLNLRAELGNLADRGFHRITATWPGPRNASGPPTVLDRRTDFPKNLYVRVRRTF
jgi:outer membrane receptor protein involved in Fe transport